MTIAKLIIDQEGIERYPYIDPKVLNNPVAHGISLYEMAIIKKHFSKLTVTFGAGFTYLTEDEILAVTDLKVKKIKNTLNKKFAWFKSLSYVRQSVLVQMVYQMGIFRFLKFKKTIAYLSKGLYAAASVEMLDSAWYRQMHELDMKDGVDEENRAEWLSWMMANDKYRERRVN